MYTKLRRHKVPAIKLSHWRASLAEGQIRKISGVKTCWKKIRKGSGLYKSEYQIGNNSWRIYNWVLNSGMNCVASFWKIGKEPRQQRRGVERGESTRIVTSCALWFVDFWDFQKLGRQSSKAGCHGQRSPSTAGGNLERPPVFWQSPALLRPWGEWETSTGGVNRVPPLHPKLFRWDILASIHWSSYFIFLVRNSDIFNRSQIQIFGFGVLEDSSNSIVYISVSCEALIYLNFLRGGQFCLFNLPGWGFYKYFYLRLIIFILQQFFCINYFV